MKKLLENLFIRLLNIVRKMIEIISIHAMPRLPLRGPIKKFAYQYNREDKIKDSYNHFKKYFDDAVFLEYLELREHAIKEALLNHKSNYYYMEFGVYRGSSINQLSEILDDITIYGFDSFEGLREDWKGSSEKRGAFDLKKKVPKLNNNCVPVAGWVQDTLPKFVSEHQGLELNFVHMDLDTYPSTKFVLQNIKPHLVNGAIILFDELYNFDGWKVGEYKALTEMFNENEYRFLAFAIDGSPVTIQYINKNKEQHD